MKPWNRHPNSKFEICIWNCKYAVQNSKYLFRIPKYAIHNSKYVFGIPKYAIYNSIYVFGIPNTYSEFQIHYSEFQIRIWNSKQYLEFQLVFTIPNTLFKQLEGTRITGMPIPRSLHPHLKWWVQEENVLQGQPLHPLNQARQIFTGASKEGWGTHLGEYTARGTWSLPKKASCI